MTKCRLSASNSANQHVSQARHLVFYTWCHAGGHRRDPGRPIFPRACLILIVSHSYRIVHLVSRTRNGLALSYSVKYDDGDVEKVVKRGHIAPFPEEVGGGQNGYGDGCEWGLLICVLSGGGFYHQLQHPYDRREIFACCRHRLRWAKFESGSCCRRACRDMLVLTLFARST